MWAVIKCQSDTHEDLEEAEEGMEKGDIKKVGKGRAKEERKSRQGKDVRRRKRSQVGGEGGISPSIATVEIPRTLEYP